MEYKMDEQIDEWRGCMGGLKEEGRKREMHGGMDDWLNRWICEWITEWMNKRKTEWAE